MRFTDLNEGPNDPGIFKAIFLAGGPGSGKSYVAGQLGLVSRGLKVLNSDDAFEYLMRKHNLSFEMPPEEQPERDVARTRAKTITKKKQDIYLDGRLGLIIDGTAKDPEKMAKLKAELEAIGYQTMMVFVNTSLRTALQRNLLRDRKVPSDIVTQSHKLVQANKSKLADVFAPNYVEINNDENPNFNEPLKRVDRFIDAPVTPKAKDWISKAQLQKTVKSEGVIYNLDKNAPMDDSEVLVLGGAGRYTMSGLRDKARREAGQLAKGLETNHGQAFRSAAQHVKQLSNTLNTVVAAYDELNDIRKKGGVKSKGIRNEDTQSKPKVYVDMDGVIANFYAGVTQVTGHAEPRELALQDMEDTMASFKGTDFFYQLPKYEQADQLIALVNKMTGGDWYILSSPLKYDREGSAKHKAAWIRDKLKIQPKGMHFTGDKAQFAKQPDGTPNILIDDYPKYLNSWIEKGGIGVKYKGHVGNIEDVKATLDKYLGQQGVAEGINNITYKQQKGKNKFSVEMLVDGKTAGVFQYDANTGRTITELDPAFRGQGLGQRLILKGIYTAAMLGMDYVEDESRTAMFDRAMDSLADAGYIVNDEEYWYVTDSGEQFLKQGVAEAELNEIIRKVKGGYRLLSKKGKNLGTYPSKAGAEKRERQVQYFKHMGEDNKLLDNPIYYDRLETVEEGPKDFDDMKLDTRGKQDSIDYFYKDHAPSMGKLVKAGKLGSHDIVTVTKGPTTLMFLVDANDSAVFYVGFDKYQDGVAIGNVRSNGTVKATDVYAYLVKKYGKLYSDKHQTPNGRKIWDNLSKYTKLKVTDVGDRLMATENFKHLGEDVTQSDLEQIERYADKLFGTLGIDVNFTRHFIDRVNDARNGKPITPAELTRLFKQEFKRWGKPIAQMGPDAEAVMKDMQTDINMPFLLKWDRDTQELDLIAKTIMRKQDFKSPDPVFPVENKKPGRIFSIVNELADNPYDYIQNVKTPDKRAYRFQTDAGQLYRVQVFNRRSPNMSTGGINNKLEIHFDLTDTKTGKPETGKTGTGDAVRVFSTVGAILKKEVADQDPTGIIIASKADDESRVKLYRTLARRAAKTIPGFEISGEHNVTGADGNPYITIELKKQ